MSRRLSRRISGCAGSNPASRIFFCPCSLMVKLSAVNRSSKVRFLPGTISYNIRILYEMAHSSRVNRNQKKRPSRDTRRRRRSRTRVSNNTGTGLGLVGSLVGAAAISQGSELEEQSSDPMMMSGGKRGRGGASVVGGRHPPRIRRKDISGNSRIV